MEPNFQKPGNTPFICKFQQQQIQAYMLLFSQIFKHIQANLSLQTAVRKQDYKSQEVQHSNRQQHRLHSNAQSQTHRPQLQPPGVQHHTITHTHTYSSIQNYRAMKKQEVQVQRSNSTSETRSPPFCMLQLLPWES